MLSSIITVDGYHPLDIPIQTAYRLLGQKRVKRMLHAGWLKVSQQGGKGRETRLDTASIEAGYQRILAGETPPLLPCEQRALERKRQAIGSNVSQEEPRL